MARGRAYLIGAGPGDPRLLTLRGAEVLSECDEVFYDALVHPDVLRHAPRARLVPVGKRCGTHSVVQEEICRRLVDSARAGAIVGRLKGGDPLVFGRGGEEALALRRAGVPFEIVPGVTAALGAAAYAGIPLTHRGLSTSVSFVAARTGALAPPGEGTRVLFMCQRELAPRARELVAGGLSPSTPAAVVRGATLPCQEIFVGSLGDLARIPSDWSAALDPTLPTLAIVGDVAALHDELAWFGAPARPIARLAGLADADLADEARAAAL